MTVTAVRKDADKLTLTLDAEFESHSGARLAALGRPAPAGALVGPAELPGDLHLARPASRRARVVLHDRPGRATSPLGYWEIVTAEPPRRIEMIDGFANADGSPNEEMPGPGAMNVTIEPIGEGRTRMSIESIFPDATAMEQLLAMGQEEGLTEAVGQIDAILAEDTIATAGDRR